MDLFRYFCQHILLERKQMKKEYKRLDKLYDDYYRALCLYALHYITDINKVQDIVHDAYLLLLTAINNREKIGNKKAYLYTLVRKLSLDYINKSGLLFLPEEIYKEHYHEELIKLSQLEERLWVAIDELPDKCKEIFLMNKRDGMKYAEIASELGLSVETVESHMSNAYAKLKPQAKKIYNYSFLAYFSTL